jgi:hypothetical protein
MKQHFWLAFLVLMTAFPLFAQQDSEATRRPPSVAEVMKFFEVMHIHDQMQSMLQTERQQFHIIIQDMFSKRLPNATPEQRAQFQKLTEDAMNDLIKNYPLDDVLRDMVPVYQAHLTESDLNEVIAFYSSATGQRLLKEMPTMTAEAMRVSYARLQPEIQKMMQDMDGNIKKMVADPAFSEKPTQTKPAP